MNKQIVASIVALAGLFLPIYLAGIARVTSSDVRIGKPEIARFEKYSGNTEYGSYSIGYILFPALVCFLAGIVIGKNQK